MIRPSIRRARRWTGLRPWLLGLTLAALPPAAPAPAAVLPGAAPLLERLEAALDPLRDIDAEFVQVRHISLTDESVEARGRLRFLSPDYFRLDYREPEADQLVMWADSVLVYNPAVRQAQRNFLDRNDASRNILLLFASRRGQLGGRFDVSLAPPAPGGAALRFQPLAGTLDYPITEIQVRLNPKTNLPAEIFVREEEGDSSLFRLENVRTNRRLKPADFVLRLPAGTEIIEH